VNFGINFDNVFLGQLIGASVGEYIKLINIKLHHCDIQTLPLLFQVQAVLAIYSVHTNTCFDISAIRRDLVQTKRVKCVVSSGTLYSPRTVLRCRNM